MAYVDPKQSKAADGGLGCPRRIVSALYVLCLAALVWYNIHSSQRAAFAEALSQIALVERPADIPALEQVLGDSIDHQVRWTMPPGTGEPDEERIFFKEGKGVFLIVDLNPSTEDIRQFHILWAVSKELPLDDPANGLPKPDYVAVLFCIVALWCWHYLIPRLRPGLMAKTLSVLLQVLLLPMGLCIAVYVLRSFN